MHLLPIVCTSLLGVLLLPVLRFIYWRAGKHVRPRTVAVVVLGDVGRSPRMMYHAQSFAREGFQTFIIGYFDSQLPNLLRRLSMIRSVPLSPFPSLPFSLPFIVLAPFKALWQLFVLFNSLTSRLPYIPNFIMVQNPPSIPTLFVVKVVAAFCGTKVIIDWHNLGYSILALRFNSEYHPLVLFAKLFEQHFGQTAYAHLFVTSAMKLALAKDWNLRGIKVVLHDRPPPNFRRSLPVETHELFSRITPSLTDLETFLPRYELGKSTPFTVIPTERASSSSYTSNEDISIALRPDRPALVVSSTSWTDDEDFSILLRGLELYEEKARQVNSSVDNLNHLPRILCVVTGKGPNREKYLREVACMIDRGKWVWVRCISVWLSAEDYPQLLGSADLGVSLHYSSSALDLPMKVVDMFGCGVPVCALNFDCLHELVKDGINGLVFRTPEELASQFESTLMGFPDAPMLSKLQTSLRFNTTSVPRTDWEWGSWDENWDELIRPLVV